MRHISEVSCAWDVGSRVDTVENLDVLEINFTRLETALTTPKTFLEVIGKCRYNELEFLIVKLMLKNNNKESYKNGVLCIEVCPNCKAGSC